MTRESAFGKVRGRRFAANATARDLASRVADQRVSICFTKISIVSVDRLNQSGTFMAFMVMIAASKGPLR